MGTNQKVGGRIFRAAFNLDQLEQFREHGIESDEETGSWMRAFSEILPAPPEVELLRVE